MSTFSTLLTGGGLAVIGGLLSGALTNWLGSKRDERRYKHERVVAAEARRQERLAETYIALLTVLSRYWDWARSMRPIGASVPKPNPLPHEERWRIEALVTAYGSHEVNRLLGAWGEQAERIEYADWVIRRVEESENPSKQLENEAHREHLALPTYKEAMQQIDDAIRARVSQELAGES